MNDDMILNFFGLVGLVGIVSVIGFSGCETNSCQQGLLRNGYNMADVQAFTQVSHFNRCQLLYSQAVANQFTAWKEGKISFQSNKSKGMSPITAGVIGGLLGSTLK